MPPPSRLTKDPSHTLTTQKRNFLTSQIRLLSTPLTTPPTSDSHSNSPDISRSALASIASKTNRKIKQYNHLAFPVQSQRHVLEQVEAVYWRDALAKVYDTESAEYLRTRAGKEATVVNRSDDLRLDEVVSGLPESWEDVVLQPRSRSRSQPRVRPSKRRRIGISSHNETQDATRSEETYSHDDDDWKDDECDQEYKTLHTALSTHQQRRKALRRKLELYRHLATLLAPYAHAKEDVQPNLVTRGGELEEELDRMRVLCARIQAGGGMRRVREKTNRREPVVQRAVDQRAKLEYVLGLG